MHPNQEMTNYKDYSLDKLKEWLHDVLSCEDATPDEVFDVFKEVVQESYDYHKSSLDKAKRFLDMINGIVTDKWVVPVEQFEGTDECLITFPDDLIEKVGWKEGDTLNWKDNGDGSFTLTKVVK